MGQYFAKEWAGPPFELFGSWHLGCLIVTILINLSFIWLRKSENQTQKDRVRYGIVIMLALSEGSWHVWNIAIGEWTIQTHLPFHLCAVLVWTSIIMLLTKNYKIYEFSYFLGIAGASQALLTPEAGIYGFPHYRVFQTICAHGASVTAAFFMTLVEGFRPTWASFKRVIIWLNIYGVTVLIINVLLGSNYMFLLRKPETASLMDFLGPWPVYLFALEAIALFLCFLLYVPWMIKDRQNESTVAYNG